MKSDETGDTTYTVAEDGTLDESVEFPEVADGGSVLISGTWESGTEFDSFDVSLPF